jgi:predicted RNase H-like nuclease (RuvC/YqgF family)
MGYGIQFKPDIFIPRLTLSTVSELKDKIEETEEYIEDIQRRLLMWASSNPRDVIPEDWKNEPINFIRNEVSELIDFLLEESTNLHNLKTLLEYVKTEKITDLKTLQS